MTVFKEFDAVTNGKYAVGRQIGRGTQGEVFELLSDSDRVLKCAYLDSDVSHTVEKNESIKKSFLAVMKYLKHYQHSCFLKVYDYGVVDARKIPNAKSGRIHISFSIVERLKKLEPREEYLFDTIEPYTQKRSTDFEKVRRMIRDHASLYEMNLDTEKLMNFYNKLICAPVNHNDMCGSNFMKNTAGDYKAIDLDRATMMY